MAIMAQDESRALLPWSHRLPIWARFLVDICAGAAVGVIGTMAHRMGASMNIPYGLALAYLIVILSTWCARSRDGISGLALHLIGSSLMVWSVMAGYGPGGDVIIPVGFDSSAMPFFSQYAGYFWLYGIVIIPVLMLVVPRRWFVTPPRTDVESNTLVGSENLEETAQKEEDS